MKEHKGMFLVLGEYSFGKEPLRPSRFAKIILNASLRVLMALVSSGT